MWPLVNQQTWVMARVASGPRDLLDTIVFLFFFFRIYFLFLPPPPPPRPLPVYSPCFFPSFLPSFLTSFPLSFLFLIVSLTQYLKLLEPRGEKKKKKVDF